MMGSNPQDGLGHRVNVDDGPSLHHRLVFGPDSDAILI
jgi:hypothetical protein